MEVKMRRRRRRGGSGTSREKLHGSGKVPKDLENKFAGEGCDDTNLGTPEPQNITLEIEKVSFRFHRKISPSGYGLFHFDDIAFFLVALPRVVVPAGAGEILGGWWHGRKWRRRNWRGAKAFILFGGLLPIGSMNVVYLPTFAIKINQLWVKIPYIRILWDIAIFGVCVCVSKHAWRISSRDQTKTVPKTLLNTMFLFLRLDNMLVPWRIVEFWLWMVLVRFIWKFVVTHSPITNILVPNL